jgi:hypothetical protein
MKCRFLAEDLAFLIAEYLAIVRPVEIFFSTNFHQPGEADLREFLWADFRKGIWDGDYLSGLFKQYTSQHEMHGLGFQKYRQVATAFMEVHLKYKEDYLEKDQDSTWDLQAGHSSKTAGIAYARAYNDHRMVSRDFMHQYYLISNDWNDLILKAGLKESKKGIIFSLFMKLLICIEERNTNQLEELTRTLSISTEFDEISQDVTLLSITIIRLLNPSVLV